MHTRDQLYIDGKWVDALGKGSIDVINPATEKIIGKVPVGSTKDVDKAVAAAKSAFNTWSKSNIDQRIDLLNALSYTFKERGEELAQTITAEVGTPIGYSRVAMVGTPRVVSRSYAKILEDFSWEEEVRNSIVCKEPVGVCAFITPWNFPLHQIIGKVAPAIAAGCTMVLKPSKEAPLSAFILAEILDEIGLPAGVFNLVSGHGSEVGDYMSSHPDVDMVSFTGSTGAGVSVSQSAAPTIKRVTLELGGKSANVALDDADPIMVAKKAIGACHQNSGQTCSALTRLIIPETMNEQVCEIIAGKNDLYLAGDPLDEATRCGPMVSSRQQSSVTEYIKSGINEGATLISGGLGMPDGLTKGFYVKPTVFANVTTNMRVWKEEIFGPVLVIATYKTEDEALSLANDSIYGLSGGVWSESKERAINFAKKMRTGQVSINGGAFNVSAPFGGYKLSGNGRELGTYGLDEFLEIKSIQL
ncbi:MAG: aldehyde dehydrogenase family protein [Candidatus Poseidoniales archaeon]|jgi:aldehyde dehydrogenase (NAD+)|nr:aldehyde dehydrogenase family protein [Candidatus Poseidoniales archaeon]|tara:strand:+ start:1949 stop:3367 length:1419 start_codon:yes stop_codon:yes gene_type:complete